MSKLIVQRVKYIERKQISDYDRDQIEPIAYLNVFKFGDIFYGFKEYDYFRNNDLKSNAWKLGSYMNLQFIPKGHYKGYNSQIVTIIQRAKVVN